MGDSLIRLRAAPAGIRSKAGYQLGLVQHGGVPNDFRPMPDVGSGVSELRLHGDNEYRVMYVARFEEAVYVLHCFPGQLGRSILTWPGAGTRPCWRQGNPDEKRYEESRREDHQR